MAPAKRTRASSPSGSSTAASAPASKRARAVHSRVDCTLRPPPRREEGANPRQPLLALKRPPMKLHQERSAPPKAAVTKVDYSRPAAVSDEQLEAWRAARRQKLAERILRGRPASASSAPAAAAASCLGVDAERHTATSRPRAVASRLLQPRANRPQPEMRRAQTEPPVAAPAPARGRAASTSQTSATATGPAPAVAGIRMNKAAQRRLTMMQARRQQSEREAERRRTISGPLPKAAPRQRAASHRPGTTTQRPGASTQRPGTSTQRPGTSTQRPGTSTQRPGAPPRQTVAAGRPGVSAPVSRRQTLTVGRRPGAGAAAAGVRRSTLGCVASPRGARLGRQRLAELSRPRAAAAAVKRSPPRARVARPVQRRPPPAASGVAQRASLTAMHRHRAALNPAAAIHRAASHPPADAEQTTAAEVDCAGGAGVSRASAVTPGRQRASSAAVTGRGRPSSAMTPGHQGPSLPTLQQRLQQWLTSRGKTLSSYRHLSCFGHEARTPARTPAAAASRRRTTAAAPKLEVDPGSPPLRARTVSPAPPVSNTSPKMAAPPLTAAESGSECTAAPSAEDGGERMDNALTDLKELQDLGLPADQVVSWLERLAREPQAAGHARFWLCRASVAEREGRLDAVLDCFREASHAKAEPVAELVSGLERFVHRATSGGDDDDADDDAENRPPSAAAAGGPAPRRSRRGDARTPRRPLLDHGNVFNSTVIKYAVVDDLPVLKKLATLREGAGEPVLSVITPVRRSTRRKSLRPATNPHLVLFDSIEAISESLRQSAHFRRNSALVSP